jgi:lipoprotein-anchoring transpeptidase ErfK/SrfK
MPQVTATNSSTSSTRPAQAAALALTNPRLAGIADLSPIARGAARLGVGARGPAALAVQAALFDMGFSLPGGPDGAYGRGTAKAVRNFQTHARAGFPAVQISGEVDQATLRALDALAPLPGQKGQRGLVPAPTYRGQSVRIIVVKNEHRTFKFDRQGRLEAIVGNSVGKPATPTPTKLCKVTGYLDAAGTAALARRKGYDLDVYGPLLIDLSNLNGSRSGQELHGTNAPNQLGEDVSGGCVRHLNADVALLRQGLSIGDRVALVGSMAELQVDRAGLV